MTAVTLSDDSDDCWLGTVVVTVVVTNSGYSVLMVTVATAVTTVVGGDDRDRFEWDSEFSCSRQHKSQTTVTQRCGDNLSSSDFLLFATQRKIRVTILKQLKSKNF
jgi:hypothetical protein